MPTGGVDEGRQFINKKILSSAILLYDWCCGNKKQKQKHFPGVSWQSFHYTIMTIKSCQEMLHRTKSIIFSKEWEVTVVNLSEQILIEKKNYFIIL